MNKEGRKPKYSQAFRDEVTAKVFELKNIFQVSKIYNHKPHYVLIKKWIKEDHPDFDLKTITTPRKTADEKEAILAELDSGKSMHDLAKEHGLSWRTIRAWQKKRAKNPPNKVAEKTNYDDLKNKAFKLYFHMDDDTPSDVGVQRVSEILNIPIDILTSWFSPWCDENFEIPENFDLVEILYQYDDPEPEKEINYEKRDKKEKEVALNPREGCAPTRG